MVEEEVAEVYGAVVAVILAGAPIVATLVRDGVVVMAVTVVRDGVAVVMVVVEVDTAKLRAAHLQAGLDGAEATVAGVVEEPGSQWRGECIVNHCLDTRVEPASAMAIHITVVLSTRWPTHCPVGQSLALV